LQIILLTSCITMPGYPQRWGMPIKITDNIESLFEGTYSAYGESIRGYSPPDYYALNLLAVFSPPEESKYFSAIKGVSDKEVRDKLPSTFSIQKYGNDGLQISATRNNELLYTKRIIKNHDYIIEDGWVKMNPESTIGSAGIKMIGYGGINYNITLSEDKHLILKRESYVAGIGCLIIPVAGYQFDWFRFKRISDKALIGVL
jgi:hypothetical protein